MIPVVYELSRKRDWITHDLCVIVEWHASVENCLLGIEFTLTTIKRFISHAVRRAVLKY